MSWHLKDVPVIQVYWFWDRPNFKPTGFGVILKDTVTLYTGRNRDLSPNAALTVAEDLIPAEFG